MSDQYDVATGQLTVLCLSCNCHRPIRYGYTQRVVGAVTFDTGGLVNPTRVLTDTQMQTFCATCGHRVYTDAEIRESNERSETKKTIHVVLLVFAILAVLLLISAVLNAPLQ